MRIVAKYHFNCEQNFVENKYPDLYNEIRTTIEGIDAQRAKTKVSKEKTTYGKLLYSAPDLNQCFKDSLEPKGWMNRRVQCEYSKRYYEPNYTPVEIRGTYRDMDFVKNRLGVEVQFGKYSFMVYNVCAKMTIFHKLNIIDTGIEIVPVKPFADQMPSGVSFFEQFTWDLEHRGVSNIDIPVLILGIDQ